MPHVQTQLGALNVIATQASLAVAFTAMVSIKLFALESNYKHFKDIDECNTSNGGCSQICNNTVGSSFCECFIGYKLVNGTECLGK